MVFFLTVRKPSKVYNADCYAYMLTFYSDLNIKDVSIQINNDYFRIYSHHTLEKIARTTIAINGLNLNSCLLVLRGLCATYIHRKLNRILCNIIKNEGKTIAIRV